MEMVRIEAGTFAIGAPSSYSTRRDTHSEIAAARQETQSQIEAVRQEASAAHQSTQNQIIAAREETSAATKSLGRELRSEIALLRQELNSRFYWIIGLVLVSWLSTMGTILLKS